MCNLPFSLRGALQLHVLLGALLSLGSASAIAADFDPLRAIPGSCNAVAIVRMRDLVNSPMGQRGKWSDEVRRAYAEGLLSGPPWVKEIVQATTVGSANVGEPLTYSIYSMSPLFVIADIAKHELAPPEKIAGHQAVLSPRRVYFVQLAPGFIGAVQPASRQAVAHWVRSLDENQLTAISPDLSDALKGQASSQIVLAVDLKDMLNPQHIRNWIAGTPKLRAMKDSEGLATLLASLKTAHLSLQVTDSIAARLQLAFDSPVGDHADGVARAVAQWLDDAGARPRVLAEAKMTAADKSIAFEVPLDEVGLRRVLTLIRSPHIPPKEAALGKEGHQPNAIASAAYYNKVCDLLNSLLYKNQNAREYERTALWHEEYARKIAQLSTIAVDPELVHWGRDICRELTALARSLRGEAVHLDDLERSIRYDDTTYYQWYGFSGSEPLYFPSWVSTSDNVDQVRSQQESQVEKGAADRDTIWNMMRQATTEIARKMEYKYHIKLKLPN